MNSLLSDYGDYRPVHGSHLLGSRSLREMQVDVFLFPHGMRRILGFPKPPKALLRERKASLSVKSRNSLLIPPTIRSFDEIYLADCRTGKIGRDGDGVWWSYDWALW